VQPIKQSKGLCAVIALAASKKKAQGIAVTIADRVYFGAESSTRAS